MALIECRECSHNVSTDAKACQNCGARIPRTKWWLWIPMILIVAFLSFGAIVGNTPEAQEKAREKEAISLCWESQHSERMPLNLATQQFVGLACEKMEQNFQTKYGYRP